MGCCSSIKKQDLLDQVLELETKASDNETSLETKQAECERLQKLLLTNTAAVAKFEATIARMEANRADTMLELASVRRAGHEAQGVASAHAAAATALRGELEQSVNKNGEQSARIIHLKKQLASMTQSRTRFLRRLRTLRNKSSRSNYVRTQAEKFCDPENVTQCSIFGQQLLEVTLGSKQSPSKTPVLSSSQQQQPRSCIAHASLTRTKNVLGLRNRRTRNKPASINWLSSST